MTTVPSADAGRCREEYARATALSRRRFLGGVAASGATGVATSLFGQAVRQASFGATPGGNVLVVLSFRGGIDGLGMVVPHGDPAYYTARPTIAVGGAALQHGSRRGAQPLTVTGQDVGGGVHRFLLDVNGRPLTAYTARCRIENGWALRVRPCPQRAQTNWRIA